MDTVDRVEEKVLEVLDPDSGRILVMTVEDKRIIRLEYAE